jgi:hypothetical protein
MIDTDKAQQEIHDTCLKVMHSKKARFSEQIQAAQLLAGITGLYGPGRPKTKLQPINPDGAQEINNEGKRDNWKTLQSILEQVEEASPLDVLPDGRP